MSDLVRQMFTFHGAGRPWFDSILAADVEPLAVSVLSLLDRVGMTCPNADLLRAADRFGARVNHETETVTFPPDVVRSFVEQTRREVAAPAERSRDFRAPDPPGLQHQLAIYTYDYERREKRLGNRADFIQLAKLAETLHPEHGAGHALILSDVAAPVEPLEAALLLFQYSRHPAGVVVADARQIPYLQEIEDIAGISDPYWHWITNVSFATPLRLSREAAALLVALVTSGAYPAKVYNFGVSGANMPVTAAGSVALASAEVLALWMCCRALRPNVSLEGGLIQIGSVDMRSGGVSWWAFDGIARSLAACQFLSAWTGVSASPGGGEYTPSRYPGSYVALEKAYRAMVIAAFTGDHPSVGCGHLEAGLTLSPVQLMLDREMTLALRHLERPVVDGESLALEAMLQVGHRSDLSYLETEHTLRHFRQVLWHPQLLSRNGWGGPQEEAQVLERAQQQVNDLLARYCKPEYDLDKLSRMRAVVDRARTVMSSKETTC